MDLSHGNIDEITSLNADDLSVEELEQRLEMMAAAPMDDFTCNGFTCSTLQSCGPLTSCTNFKFGPNQ